MFIGKEARAWMSSAARLGHVSTGAVYIVLGIVALSAAIDAHVRVTGAQGGLCFVVGLSACAVSARAPATVQVC